MNTQVAFEFGWLSPLGISVILFLGYGALNVLVGVIIPWLSRRLGTRGLPQHQVDMLTMLWLAFGIFQLGVVWFGLREGQAWAFWVIVAADIAQLVGWIAYGMQSRDWYAPLFLYDAICLIPAAVLGWFGLH